MPLQFQPRGDLVSAIQQDNADLFVKTLIDLYFKHYETGYRRPNLSRVISHAIKSLSNQQFEKSYDIHFALDAMCHTENYIHTASIEKSACIQDAVDCAIELLPRLRFEFIRALCSKNIMQYSKLIYTHRLASKEMRCRIQKVMMNAIYQIAGQIQTIEARVPMIDVFCLEPEGQMAY
jgi:hypothetical protein